MTSNPISTKTKAFFAIALFFGIGSSLVASPAMAAGCANGTTLSAAEFYSAMQNGQVIINLTLDPAAHQTSTHFINNTDCAAPVSFADYKMYDWVLSHQVFYSGSPLVTVQAHTSRDFFLTVPSCKTQIDFDYGEAPHTLEDSNPYVAPHDPFTAAYAYSGDPFCTNIVIPPTLSCSPTTQTVNVGDPANFSAAGGTSSYNWSASGGNPSNGSGTNFSTTYNTAGQKTVTLTSGSATAQCAVTVNDIPPPPVCSAATIQTLAASNVTHYSATLNGMVNPQGHQTNYHFEYGTSASLGQSTVTQPAGAGNGSVSVSANITNLQANTTYYFRLVADNSCGSNTGSLMTFTTQNTPQLTCNPGTQTVNVGDTANFWITGGIGTYNWNAPGGTPNSGTGSNFSTAYANSGTKTVTVTSGSQTAQCTVNVNEVQNTQLTCSPATQTIAPGNYANFSATGGTGSYNWSAPGGNPSTGTGSNFSSNYSTSGTKSVVVTSGSQSASCNVIVSDLPPPPVCTLVNVQTLSATNVAPGSAMLNGTINPNGKATTYYFEYGTTPSFGNTTPTQSLGATTGTVSVSWTVSNLQPNVTYYFRLVATSECGTIQGTTFTFTTNGVPPSPLTCTSQNNTISVNSTATFYASGGNGNYSWSAFDGNPAYATGITFATIFSTAGTKYVTVTSNGQSAQCSVSVIGSFFSSNFEITKLVLNRTLNQTTFVNSVEAQSLDTLDFEIHVRNTGSAANQITLRDILPAELSYVFGTTQMNNTFQGDGITGAGISLGTVNPGEEKMVRFETTVLPGTTPRTITNQASAIMNGDTRNAFATITIRPRGQVLGVSDVVTGPEDVLPWVLGLGLLGSTLSYYFLFRKEKMIAQGTYGISAPIFGSMTKEQKKMQAELDRAIAEIKRTEGEDLLKADY